MKHYQCKVLNRQDQGFLRCKEGVALSIYNCPWANPVKLTLSVKPWCVWAL